MKRLRERKPIAIDPEHMRLLHAEAMEQLELMQTAVVAETEATDALRDKLDDIAANHWHSYMDVLHMICAHDTTMYNILKQQGVDLKEIVLSQSEERINADPKLILALLAALLRRHRRMDRLFSLRNPIGDYLKDSMSMELEHMCVLITMLDKMY